MRCPRTPKAASPLRMAATRPLLVWLLLALLIPTLLLCSGGGAHAAVGAVSFRSKAAVSWRTFGDSARTAKPHLMAAAAARFVSISACYPIDTIKTRLQMGSAAAADSMKGGMAGMYLGLGGSLFGQVPYGMLAFGTYEMYKAALLEKFPGVPQAFTFCAAAILGDLTGSLWLVPSEVVKVQMQGGLHSSFSAATVSIFTKSGIGGFYQGIGGQVVRDVPFRAIQLTSYELLKNLHRAWRKKSVAMEKKHDDNNGNDNNNDQSSKPEFSAGDSALLGGIAGAISATFTCPLDVIRTRLMVGAQEGVTAAGGAGTWAGAIKEGGLFAGVGTRIFYVGVSSAIFFVVYESVKQQIFLTRATTAGVGGGGSAKSERATR